MNSVLVGLFLLMALVTAWLVAGDEPSVVADGEPFGEPLRGI